MSDADRLRKKVAAALRDRREALHLTQEQVAGRCTMSVRYLRQLEAGRSSVGVETLQRLLAALDWSWAGIAGALEDAGDSREAPRNLHRLLDSAWKKGGVQQRDLIARLMKTLAG